jgi:small GTP-binding protein
VRQEPGEKDNRANLEFKCRPPLSGHFIHEKIGFATIFLTEIHSQFENISSQKAPSRPMNLKKTAIDQDTTVIIVGDTSVGKTRILCQFNSSTFDENTESTVGASYVQKAVDTARGKVTLLIWDTAGQERYRSLIPMYSRNAAAALLVVDVSNPASCQAIDGWLETLKENCPPRVRIYLVANKIDLVAQYPVEDLERWASEHQFPFFKTCAAEHQTVVPVFVKIAEDMAGPDLQWQPAPAAPQPAERVEEKEGCC